MTAFLRGLLHASTHAVFVGLLIAAVLTLAILLVVPRRFAMVDDQSTR